MFIQFVLAFANEKMSETCNWYWIKNYPLITFNIFHLQCSTASTRHLRPGLKLTTSLHQESLCTYWAILTPNGLIIIHLKLHFYRFLHSRTVHLHIIKVFYLPIDAQESCFKKNIKIHIKTAPTCFGLITIIRERITRSC